MFSRVASPGYVAAGLRPLANRVPLLSRLAAHRIMDSHPRSTAGPGASLPRPECLSECRRCGPPERGHPAKGGDRGYDAGKHTKGRKRHIVVDVLGLILEVSVTGAHVQDRDGAPAVLGELKDRFPRLQRVWADGAYAGKLVEWAQESAQLILDIVRKPKGQVGFAVLLGVGSWSAPSPGWAIIVAWLAITRSMPGPARPGLRLP